MYFKLLSSYLMVLLDLKHLVYTPKHKLARCLVTSGINLVISNMDTHCRHIPLIDVVRG